MAMHMEPLIKDTLKEDKLLSTKDNLTLHSIQNNLQKRTTSLPRRMAGSQVCMSTIQRFYCVGVPIELSYIITETYRDAFTFSKSVLFGSFFSFVCIRIKNLVQ